MGGTLTSRRVIDQSRPVQLRASAAGTSGLLGGPRPGTLLGPEGAVRRSFGGPWPATLRTLEESRVDGCYGSTVLIGRPGNRWARDVVRSLSVRTLRTAQWTRASL
jgi:hypothetical protein